MIFLPIGFLLRIAVASEISAEISHRVTTTTETVRTRQQQKIEKANHGSLLRFRICLVLTLLSVLIGVVGEVCNLAAEWASSTTQNLPLCTAQNEQHFPVLVADGEGGVIVAWSDARNANRDIFAQRVNATGEMLWHTDGIEICELPSSQSWPLIVDDSNGGAILVWGDTRQGNQDSYTQRINANGEKLWNPEGVPVCTHPTLQDDLNAIADGQGGVIVVWEDWRNGNQDIYAQRIDSTGIPLWESNGVPVYSGAGDQYDPVLLADGEGGAIFAWWDISAPEWNIFAQRLSADGEPMWHSPVGGISNPDDAAPSAAIPVCTAKGNQGAPSIVTDENGGAFFIWSDYRNDPNFYTTAQLYAQRITGDGTALWQKDGLPICELPVNQQQPSCIRDGAGGFIVVWWDERDIFADIYAQRVSTDGKALWDIAGVPVCTEAGVQRVPQLVSVDNGGAIVYWLDYREDFGDSTEDAIYAQRLDANGEPLWEKDGVPVCTAPKAQITPQAVPIGVGSAIVVWSDARGADYDIYIHRVP